MDVVTGWTGRTACALQTALRMSNDVFAAHLDIGARTVADWHQKPGLRPRPDTQQLLDTALARATPEAAGRFAILTGQSSPAASARQDENGAAADAEHRLITDENISGALGRLDLLASWDPGTARRQVAARLTALDRRDLLDRASRRRRIGRRAVADALGAYYRGQAGEHGRYGAHCGHDGTEIVTSILTHPEWLDLGCALTADHDRLTLAGAAGGDLPLDATAADAAVQRLAEILVAGTRFVDMPLYRLAGIDAGKGQISGSLGITQFASYALTLDLLEGELSDALTAGVSPEPGLLPLRDRYLPDLASVLGVAGRLCAGGPLALSAFARPADPCRGPADYVLLVQERSGSVVNAARQLAVIPKGFHQPMADYRGDAKIAATLRREMEEELFGREDIDNTIITERNAADPMHPARLSAPMRWLLTENPGALRIECTGFGLNLVSGNFEFASLIVVDSDDFWHRFGSQIEASWESSSLRQYSSLDSGSLAALAHDDAWSNEGLFAFLQGLRRLSQVGGDRVDMPAIDWMVRP